MVLGGAAGQPSHILEFDGVTWHAVMQIPTPDLPPVAIDNGAVLIGNEAIAGQQGAVFAYDKVGGIWQQTHSIVATDAAPFSRFGHSLSVEDGRLAVGAPADDAIVQNGGALYVFDDMGTEWQQSLKAVTQTPAFSDTLGYSVDLNGANLVGGTPGPFGSIGRASVFTLRLSIGTAYGAVTPNSTGVAALLVANGSTVVGYDCLSLSVESMPPGQFGYFLMSMSQGYLPLFGGSQGNLHLAFPIVRFSGDILLSDANGEATFSPPLNALPQGTMFQPGETWNFQMWFRDTNPGLTSNTSNGLALTFETTGDPSVQFPATLLSVEEETTQFSVSITLSQATDRDVTIPYTTRGTATHGVEWRVEEPNPIVIPAGATSVHMTIVMAEDAVQEGDETGVIELGAPTGGVLGSAPLFTLTIVDDD